LVGFGPDAENATTREGVAKSRTQQMCLFLKEGQITLAELQKGTRGREGRAGGHGKPSPVVGNWTKD